MVEIEIRCRIPIYGGRLGEFNGMSSQSHVSHCWDVLPALGEFTVTIPELHATLQDVRIPSASGHIENRFSPYFIFFKIQFIGFDERRPSYRLRYTRVDFSDFECHTKIPCPCGHNSYRSKL